MSDDLATRLERVKEQATSDFYSVVQEFCVGDAEHASAAKEYEEMVRTFDEAIAFIRAHQ